MYKCRICGKTDKKVEMLFGGIVGYAHQKCTINLDRIIEVYLEFIVTCDSGVVYLANELIEAQKRVDSWAGNQKKANDSK